MFLKKVLISASVLGSLFVMGSAEAGGAFAECKGSAKCSCECVPFYYHREGWAVRQTIVDANVTDDDDGDDLPSVSVIRRFYVDGRNQCFNFIATSRHCGG